MPLTIKSAYYSTLCLLAAISSYANAINVTLATGINDDPPYVYGDKKIDLYYPGITIDILNLIEKKTDITFTILKQPWARVVSSVKANQLDGGFHFSFKQERTSFVAYPILKGQALPDPKFSISNRAYALYRLKGNEIYWDGEKVISSRQGFNDIGVIRGSSISQTIENPNTQLFQVNTDNQLIQLLLAKRIDALVGLENMLDPKIQSLGPEQAALIEKNFPAVVNKPYYVAFSKRFYQENPQTAWTIWKTIDLIKQNGELATIYSRYADRE